MPRRNSLSLCTHTRMHSHKHTLQDSLPVLPALCPPHSAFGRVPVMMRYDGDLLSVSPAALGAPLHLVLVDLRAGKDTVAILAGLQVRAAGGRLWYQSDGAGARGRNSCCNRRRRRELGKEVEGCCPGREAGAGGPAEGVQQFGCGGRAC